jgi:hypothetical protein
MEDTFFRFVNNPIPSVIHTSHFHQPPKCRKNSNCVQPSYSDIALVHVPNENDSDVTCPNAANTATQRTNHVNTSGKAGAQILHSPPGR